jgi:hypothetical protein
MSTLNAILLGAIAMASAMASLYFLRFWKSTRDRLFLFFSIAFLLETAQRVLFGLAAPVNEDAPEYFLLRLAAYGLIVFAVIDKNRRNGRGR